MVETIIEVKNCSKSFTGVKVFDGLDFDLARGEIHCIVGENGAGKSTLIKILSGAYKPDCGAIIIGGKAYSHLTPRLSFELGIFTIYQEQFLIQDLTVYENVFLGSEPKNRLGQVNFKLMKTKTDIIFKSLQIPIEISKTIRELSTAERHLVQIAKTLIWQPKVLIMDEPTASLGRNETKILLDSVRTIAKSGVGIIYISHHLEEVFEIADRVTVLRDGVKISVYKSKDLTTENMIRDMVGRNAEMFYTREVTPLKDGILEAIGYSRKDKINNCSFKIRQGEIVGLAGMVGAGRTELARLIFGADKKNAGILLLNGRNITPSSPRSAIKNGICLITEDRQHSGLILEHSLRWNVSLVKNVSFKGLRLRLWEEKKDSQTYRQKMNVRTTSIEKEVKYLSGGNQQKVVLIKWLLVNSKIIIFDEPTRGIDIGAKEEIYKLMTQLAREGKYILMISSDMPELISMSDRIYVMNQGSIRAELSCKEISEETVLKYAL